MAGLAERERVNMTDKIAEAYANVGKALLDLADALTAHDGPGAAPATFSDGTPVEEPEDWADADDEPQGSEAVCPSHRKPYLEGTYGPYCPSRSDDPDWSNRRGYCRITPKNAAAWLREHA
jgi:hypothetical protein